MGWGLAVECEIGALTCRTCSMMLTQACFRNRLPLRLRMYLLALHLRMYLLVLVLLCLVHGSDHGTQSWDQYHRGGLGGLMYFLRGGRGPITAFFCQGKRCHHLSHNATKILQTHSRRFSSTLDTRRNSTIMATYAANGARALISHSMPLNKSSLAHSVRYRPFSSHVRLCIARGLSGDECEARVYIAVATYSPTQASLKLPVLDLRMPRVHLIDTRTSFLAAMTDSGTASRPI